MKVVRALKWHTVHGRKGDRRLSEEGGDLSLLCLLHILIHLVCYRYDHCLILKFYAALLEMVSLKEMVVTYHLKAFLHSTGMWPRPVHSSVRSLVYWTQSAFHTAAWESWFFRMLSSSTSGNLSLELNGIIPYFVLLVGESLEVFELFQAQASTSSHSVLCLIVSMDFSTLTVQLVVLYSLHHLMTLTQPLSQAASVV